MGADMYSGILYIIIGMLIVVSLLLFLVVQVLNARGRAITREKMLGDIERIENLEPPQIEGAEQNQPAQNNTPASAASDNGFIPYIKR